MKLRNKSLKNKNKKNEDQIWYKYKMLNDEIEKKIIQNN
jgi:hypothetical protein